MLPQHRLSFTLVTPSLASVSVCCCLPGKYLITQKCKTTPDREQYLATWSEAALIHSCQWIWRLPIPLCKETQRRRTVCCRPLKPNHPNLQRCLLRSFINNASVAGLRMEKLSATILLAAIDDCSFTFRKCQQASCQTNTAWPRPVTSPGEHLPASALRSSGADLGLTPLAYSFHSQFITFDSQRCQIDVLSGIDIVFYIVYCCNIHLCLRSFMETEIEIES